MRQLTCKEWLAATIAVALVGYFFFWNGTAFSVSTPDQVVPSETIATTTVSTSTATTMTDSTNDIDGIEITDVVVGTGEEAVVGKTVVVNYTGKFTDGTVFDSSIPRGVPFDFPLGVGMVIKGWDEGVVGMRVGGKRHLVISPEKGYGDNDYGPIPGGSTLVFDVELLDVQ